MEEKIKISSKILKINGGIFGLLSLSIIFLCYFLAYLLYPGYNIFDNMVSELGTEDGGMFFNIGVIISGILIIPFYISLSKNLKPIFHSKILRKIATISALLSSIFFSLIGLFPLNEEDALRNNIHGLFAFLHWITALLSLLLYGIIMIRDINFFKLQAIYSFVVVGIISLFFITQIPLTEWIWTFSIIIWILVNSLHLLFHKKLENK